MIKSKRQSLIVIGVFTLVMLLGSVTYAFFNYTRTGAANRISVGDIYFTSSYDEVALDGVFPIAKTTINSDSNNVMSVDVDIEGHTTYANGLYYEVKAEDVNLTVNGKNIPIGISVSSSNLDNVTLTNYEDGKVLTNGSLFANGRILASTSSVDNSVDGTITIKAYLDKDRISISDTYNGLETDLMGTTNGWVGGRVVLTTSEWNSLASTPISFKIRVEAYENDVSTFVNGPIFNTKIKILSGTVGELIDQYIPTIMQDPNYSSYTEEEVREMMMQEVMGGGSEELPDFHITSFERVYEAPNTSSFTEDNIISTDDSVYPIYAWYDNGVIKYYSKSDNIKANTDMSVMFAALMNITNIGDFSNLDTTNVTNMEVIFGADSSFTDLSFLSNWNVSNVIDMSGMFVGCGGLTNLNGLLNWNVLNVTTIYKMFRNCTNLTNLNGLSNWNTSHITTMESLFDNCTNLTNLSSLANWNTSNVKTMYSMFSKCTGLTNLSGLSSWNVSSVGNMMMMFSGDTSLSDASGINDWNIINVEAFHQMFRNAPSHPTFSKRAGTWDSNGTFTPSA